MPPKRRNTAANVPIAGDSDEFWHGSCQFSQIFEYTADDLRMSELSNGISKMFSQDLFEVEQEGKRSPLSDAIYNDVLAPSLRLATHLMYSTLLIPFWSTIFLEKPSYWEERKDETRYGMQYTYEQLDPDRKILKAHARRANAQLGTMHDYVNYVFMDRSTDLNTIQQGLSSVVIPGVPNGYRSRINIGLKMLRDLEQATKDAHDVPQLLVRRFHFAVCLVHELGHAAFNRVNGKVDCEPFFGNEIISELGFELERQLFDGRLDFVFNKSKAQGIRSRFQRHKFNGNWSALDGMYVLWDYPNQKTVEDYHGTPSLQKRYDPKRQRNCDMAWRVPLSHLQKFFDDRFWESAACADRINWQPERRLGYSFQAEEGGTCNVFPIARPSDEDDNEKEEGRKYLFNKTYIRTTYGDIILRDPDSDPVSDLRRQHYEAAHWHTKKETELPWFTSRKHVDRYWDMTEGNINYHKRRDILNRLWLAIYDAPVSLSEFDIGTAEKKVGATRRLMGKKIKKLIAEYRKTRQSLPRLPGTNLIKRNGQPPVDVERLLGYLIELEGHQLEDLLGDIEEAKTWNMEGDQDPDIESNEHPDVEEPEVEDLAFTYFARWEKCNPLWKNEPMLTKLDSTPSKLSSAQKLAYARQKLSTATPPPHFSREVLLPRLQTLPEERPDSLSPGSMEPGTKNSGFKFDNKNTKHFRSPDPFTDRPITETIPGLPFDSTGHKPQPHINSSPLSTPSRKRNSARAVEEQSNRNYIPEGPLSAPAEIMGPPSAGCARMLDQDSEEGIDLEQHHRVKRARTGMNADMITAQEGYDDSFGQGEGKEGEEEEDQVENQDENQETIDDMDIDEG
ncbi:hypothetical protein CKM354_001130600 [Cercospora kikuchii]|uniref:Uncharacterized protein n=1 Tax=Cercospora kikuchii TaxID=84275 RepID=A0A9P3D071_9PEZI|nr:uncharacterized protein CKM354_001130600 [Cercospora kikuchii]GIZ48238.1 hypothetical protein CKM354_001130600 [Cercospora kikuchii]